MFGAASGGTGLFGNNSQAKPAFGAPAAQQASFSFGSSASNTTNAFGANSANNTNNAAGASALPFSLGNSTAPKPAGTTGGLFGSSTTNNTFGSNNSTTNTAPAFGNTATGTGTLGNTNTFGATQNNTAGGLFGKPATSAPAFGAPNSSQPTLGGLFGNKPAGQTGGLFGSSNQSTQAPSTGLLGNTSTNTQSTGTGLFGATNTAGNTQTNQTGTGLFGQGTQSNTGGLFGSSAPNTQTQGQPQSGATGGLFGGSSNNPQPSFGWSNNQGNTNGQTSTLSTNLQLNLSAPPQAQKSVSNYTPSINDQIIKLREQWDPNSSKCAFKTYIYNKFSEPEIAQLLQQPRPANESPEDWENAMANRPSALHYPVKVSSFSEVAQRIEVQLDHVAKSRILLNNIYEQLNQLSSKHDLDNTTRILKAKVRHAKLSRRLLRLATVLAVLKLKGYPMLPEEEEMSKQFQALSSRLNDPNGPLGKLNDLYARLSILKSRSEDMSAYMESSIQSINGGLANFAGAEQDVSAEVAAGNEHIMNQLTKLLYKQQVGLSYLNEVVQKDLDKVRGEL